MESVKSRRVLVSDVKGARADIVHMRTIPVLTDSQRELVLQFIGGIGFLGVMALPGFIESFPWPF